MSQVVSLCKAENVVGGVKGVYRLKIVVEDVKGKCYAGYEKG